MKMIKQTCTIDALSTSPLKQIESAGRTCYQSQTRALDGSANEFVHMLNTNGHHAMLEFADATIRFVTDRGVTHELVRHRLASFAQESTRYVRYGGNMEFIEPYWWDVADEQARTVWEAACRASEIAYADMLDRGFAPQAARSVLNHSIRAEIVVKANLREWMHIFSLRCSKAAHPQIRALMHLAKSKLSMHVPVLFDN